MPTPFPHQIEGARFLAERRGALLADAPRVGKTGSAIMACDMVFARRILVVTTASARPNWKRDFHEWGWARRVGVIYSRTDRPTEDVVIVNWNLVNDPGVLEFLAARSWDVLIADESHYGKNPGTKAAQAVFGVLAPLAGAVWALSGTPDSNGPHELFTTIKACDPARLEAGPDWPACPTFSSWRDRYCRVKYRRFGGSWSPVVKGGKNIDELRARLCGFWLRRTQADVGIRQPIYSMYSLSLQASERAALQRAASSIGLDAADILDAAEAGTTKDLDMHLGVLRRLTGEIKARAAVAAIAEELENGLDRVVLMSWHTDVMRVLEEGLRKFGVVSLSGETPPKQRATAIQAFQSGAARVFNGQMQAAGEAIDLSISANLMFIEQSFNPKDMQQAALRITNHTQTRQCLVRVCALEGSIDEALSRIVMEKVSTSRKIREK